MRAVQEHDAGTIEGGASLRDGDYFATAAGRQLQDGDAESACPVCACPPFAPAPPAEPPAPPEVPSPPTPPAPPDNPPPAGPPDSYAWIGLWVPLAVAGSVIVPVGGLMLGVYIKDHCFGG